VTLTGDATNGWTLDLGKDAPVLAFLKKHTDDVVNTSLTCTAGD
jgi:hypothetical protein